MDRLQTFENRRRKAEEMLRKAIALGTRKALQRALSHGRKHGAHPALEREAAEALQRLQADALSGELAEALERNDFSQAEGLWKRAQQWGVSNDTVRRIGYSACSRCRASPASLSSAPHRRIGSDLRKHGNRMLAMDLR